MKKLILTAIAIVALATVAANAGISGQLGVLDTSGINPATGAAWAIGDTYRLAFISSGVTDATSSNIATYNSFVQGLANAAGLGGATWNIIGSTPTVDARDNTSTNPNVNGIGEAIVLMDGATIVANNYADLWDGVVRAIATDAGRAINFNENGVELLSDRVYTGSNQSGTAKADWLNEADLNVDLDGNGGLNWIADVQPRSLGNDAGIIGFSGYFTTDGVTVGTGRNHSSGWVMNGSNWMTDFRDDSTNEHNVYALSDTLTVVPEPATMALLGLGGLGLIRRRRNS